MEAVGALEEEPAVGRDRLVVADQVPEHGGAATRGVRPLDDLVELLRVADEHDVPRRRAHRERVRERNLPGLVDEEVVERGVVLGPREEPGGARGEVAAGARRRVLDARDVRALVLRLGIAAARFLEAAELEPGLGGRALDGVEQVVDRLVARRGDPDALAVGDQMSDQMPRRPCLSRARRPLDDEVPPVE